MILGFPGVGVKNIINAPGDRTHVVLPSANCVPRVTRILSPTGLRPFSIVLGTPVTNYLIVPVFFSALNLAVDITFTIAH
jgi:hypothetical protein